MFPPILRNIAFFLSQPLPNLGIFLLLPPIPLPLLRALLIHPLKDAPNPLSLNKNLLPLPKLYNR